MRIALVLPYDLARPGGVRTHTLALAAWLRRTGHDAHVIAPSSDPAAANQPWLHDVGRPLAARIGGTVGSLTLSPRVVRSVRNLLDADWDIVHIQEPLVPAIGPAALERALGRVPTVLTFHSAEPVAARLYEALGIAIRPHIRRADACIAVSTAALAIAAPVLGGPAALIPPCIDYGGAAGPGRSAETGAPVVLFVGRDEPRKGLPVLLRAIARIADREAHPAADRGPVLHVAGAARPDTVGLIERLGLAERVRLHGAVGTSEVRRLLGEASLLCAPALGGEALGLVLVEAMAASVPVVASDIDGYRIAARAGRAALLTPPGDVAALAAALERVGSDHATRVRLVAAGRASARRFDVSVVGAQHLKVYERVVRADPR